MNFDQAQAIVYDAAEAGRITFRPALHEHGCGHVCFNGEYIPTNSIRLIPVAEWLVSVDTFADRNHPYTPVRTHSQPPPAGTDRPEITC